jgi:hypothetical protein
MTTTTRQPTPEPETPKRRTLAEREAARLREQIKRASDRRDEAIKKAGAKYDADIALFKRQLAALGEFEELVAANEQAKEGLGV